MTDIASACGQFEALLREQLVRMETLHKDKKDFSKMETITIGVLDGDGIGTIIVPQAVRVLEKLLADEIASGKIVIRRINGLTIENRLARNQSVPEDVLAQIKSCDVLLKGPPPRPWAARWKAPM